jgi:hypothetical protein
MATLKNDWLTEGWIDFEYKKYLLMAYLQEVSGNFGQYKLFPDLLNVQKHYETTVQLKQAKEQMTASFPKKLTGIDLKKKTFIYEKIKESDYLSEFDSILNYSLPLFQQTLTQGQTQFADIEAQLTFAPVGIVPLHLKEGYLFLYRTRRSETDIYHYQIRLFEHHEQRGVHTTYLETVRKSVSTTFENLKLTLIKKRRELPNPATYLVESPADYPVQETLLPIAKRLIVKCVA